MGPRDVYHRDMTTPTLDGQATFHHFAYGSNLSSRRLRVRCPSATPIAVGFVRGRQLRFHKAGRDGTAKADAFWTGRTGDVVWGTIYRCCAGEQAELDRCESLGDGYERRTVEVQVDRQAWKTYLYEAMPHRIDASLCPADWYHAHVITGAAEHALPETYRRMIESVRCWGDRR